MLCPWCGANVPEKKFCENCGAALADASAGVGAAQFGAADPLQQTAPVDWSSQATQAVGQPGAQGQPAAAGQVSAQGQPAAMGQANGQGQPTAVLDWSGNPMPAGGQATQQGSGTFSPDATAQMPGVGTPIPPSGTQQAYQSGYQQPYQPASQPFQVQPSYGAPTTPSPERQPWYCRTWFVIVALLIFWPIGLVLMWSRGCTWSRATKVVLSVVIAAIFVANMLTMPMYRYMFADDAKPDGSDIAALDAVEDEDEEEAVAELEETLDSLFGDDEADEDELVAGAVDDEYALTPSIVNEVSADDGSTSSGASTEAADIMAAFAGNWVLAAMAENGEPLSEDAVELMANLGLEVELNLGEDGSAELVMFGEEMGGIWEGIDAESATVLFNGDRVDVKIVDGRLVMEDGDSSLAFARR